MSNTEPEAPERRSLLGMTGAAVALLAASDAVTGRADAQEIDILDAFEVRKRPAKRSWVIDVSGRRILCFPDPKGDCVVLGVSGFLESQTFAPFHDQQLAGLTQSINSMVSQMSPSPKRQLAILTTPDGPFLAWVNEVGVGSSDSAEIINDALGIKSLDSNPG